MLSGRNVCPSQYWIIIHPLSVPCAAWYKGDKRGCHQADTTTLLDSQQTQQKSRAFNCAYPSAQLRIIYNSLNLPHVYSDKLWYSNEISGVFSYECELERHTNIHIFSKIRFIKVLFGRWLKHLSLIHIDSPISDGEL